MHTQNPYVMYVVSAFLFAAKKREKERNSGWRLNCGKSINCSEWIRWKRLRERKRTKNGMRTVNVMMTAVGSLIFSSFPSSNSVHTWQCSRCEIQVSSGFTTHNFVDDGVIKRLFVCRQQFHFFFICAKWIPSSRVLCMQMRCLPVVAVMFEMST